MRYLKPAYLIIFTLFFSLVTMQSRAQQYKFKEFGIDEGICHSFVYSVNQDANGFLWIATGEGLCRFDGISFIPVNKTDSLSNSFSTISFKDRDDNLWFGNDDGTVLTYNGKDFNQVTPADTVISSTIKGIMQDENGEMFFCLQNGAMLHQNASGNVGYIFKGLENKFISACQYLQKGYFLIASDQGLQIYQYQKTENAFQVVTSVSEVPGSSISCITRGKGDYYFLGTEGMGLFMMSMKDPTKGYDIIDLGEIYGLQDKNVQYIMEDDDLNLWVATFGNGVYRFVKSPKKGEAYSIVNYNEENGFASQLAKTIFQDREGNIWIGSFGSGLFRMVDESFMFLEFGGEGFTSNALSIVSDNNYYWIGTDNGLIRRDISTHDFLLFNEKQGLPRDDINALYDDGKNIWIGTAKNGIYLLDKQNLTIRERFSSENSIENAVNCLAGTEELVYAGTKGGVLTFDLKTGENELFSTLHGLPHNNIKDIFIGSGGKVWIATRMNGLYSFDTEQSYEISVNYELEFTCITEDDDGNLWAGTYGTGVFKFTSDSLFFFNEEKGLKSDYVYSLVKGFNGNIWAGHRLGLSQIHPVNGTIKQYGPEIGIVGDCNQNAVCQDNNGLLLFGTTEGVITYNYKKDEVIEVPPALNITSIMFSDEEKDFSKEILMPYGIYKMKIDFIGIHLNSPESVTYQYKLEGFDLEWHTTTSRTAIYSRIEDGEYRFLLKACTIDKVCTTEPVEMIVVIVKPPFWKTWWFITLSIIAILASIFSYIKYRERKQKQLQEYLQTELDLRTAEVVKQKEEIELKNRDITDSINYAQRIQASILPSPKMLQNSFQGAFVFYEPRDIVSGDFFWYDKIDDDNLIIVCADSTGHGVPGAFMSIIGTTLIKDITMKQKTTNPSEILLNLNNELQATLNQNTELEKSTDGMDMIVLKINVKSYQAQISSAMRPYITFRDGKQYYHKGSQVAVGGAFAEEKIYKLDEIQFKKGDMIYMFSDGYTDQFGGARNKKFKMLRLKELLNKIKDQPMDVQYEEVVNAFMDWKGKYAQVDDVLFMGIKI